MSFPEFSAVALVPPDPVFPPALTGVGVRTGESPLRQAAERAAGGQAGAGDVFWSPRSDVASAAIVLEPEVPLETALQMVPVLMVAIGDALGAIGPPKLALTFRWPGTVLANGGETGRVFARFPADAEADAVPDWLVVAFHLQLGWNLDAGDEPGHQPGRTVLYEEGCGDLDRTQLIEAVSRHFLSWIDGWEQDGFAAAHQAWTAKAHEGDETVYLPQLGCAAGTRMGLDEAGGLLVKTDDQPRLLTIREAVVAGMLDDE